MTFGFSFANTNYEHSRTKFTTITTNSEYKNEHYFYSVVVNRPRKKRKKTYQISNYNQKQFSKLHLLLYHKHSPSIFSKRKKNTQIAIIYTVEKNKYNQRSMPLA